MPRFDGTGPIGTGPIGRGMGPCGGGYAGSYAGGYAGRGRGRGFFRGNFGWGMGQIDAPPFATKEAVAQRKTWLENQLAAVSKQLQDLDNK